VEIQENRKKVGDVAWRFVRSGQQQPLLQPDGTLLLLLLKGKLVPLLN